MLSRDTEVLTAKSDSWPTLSRPKRARMWADTAFGHQFELLGKAHVTCRGHRVFPSAPRTHTLVLSGQLKSKKGKRSVLPRKSFPWKTWIQKSSILEPALPRIDQEPWSKCSLPGPSLEGFATRALSLMSITIVWKAICKLLVPGRSHGSLVPVLFSGTCSYFMRTL